MESAGRSRPYMHSARIRWRIAGLIDAMTARRHPTEAMIVSGFWRSGTTWLQEAFADAWEAKTVFEPIANETRSPLAAQLARAGLDAAHRSAFIPLSVRALDAGAVTYLRRALSATASSAFSMSCRCGISESLRTRIVVKDVRFQGILGDLLDWGGGFAVHVWRHPRDVVESFRRVGWRWSFEDVRLRALHDVHAARDPDGAKEMAPLLAFDADPIERIAALWALTKRRVAALAAARGEAVRIVRYEDLLGSSGRTAIEDILADSGRTVRATPDTVRKSRTSWAARKTGGLRLDPLPAEETERILRVVEAIYPERARMLSRAPCGCIRAPCADRGPAAGRGGGLPKSL